MRTLLALSVAVFAGCAPAWGAVEGNVLTAELNMPRGGDVLERLSAEPMPAGEPGKNCFWDFSEIAETGASTRRHIAVGDTVLAAIEGGTMRRYRINGDSLVSTGYESRTIVFHDSLPYAERVFPVAYGQKISGNFYFTGRYAQDRDIETGGTVTVEADATGRMLLPSLDTLDNVLRIRTETSAWIRVLRHYEAIGDCATTDSLPSYRKTVYEWYAPGYRYPVFETRLCKYYERGRECGGYGVSYYYPEAEQESLADDPRNQAIRDEIFFKERGLYADGRGGYRGEAESENNGNGDGSREQGGMVGGITTSATPSEVAIRFDVSGGGVTIGMTLADLYGRVYGYIPEHSVDEGSHTETIDTSGLMPGDYVLTIFVDGAKHDEIILNR